MKTEGVSVDTLTVNAPGDIRRMVGPVPIWAAYLSLGTLLMLLYAFVPPFQGSGPLINLLGLSSVAGDRRRHPHLPAAPRRPPGGCSPPGSSCSSPATSTRTAIPTVGATVPFPSFGDALYLLVYPVLMAGLISWSAAATRTATAAG